MAWGDPSTLTLKASTVEAVVNCLRACANDPTEPERYRTWYAEALAEVEAQEAAV